MRIAMFTRPFSSSHFAVRKVSCGLDYTVVCTHPYVGPDLKVAGKLMEESNIRQQEALLKSRGFE